VQILLGDLDDYERDVRFVVAKIRFEQVAPDQMRRRQLVAWMLGDDRQLTNVFFSLRMTGAIRTHSQSD
jgi:hypothetical protein